MNFEPLFISAVASTYNEEHTARRLLENLKELGAEELTRSGCGGRKL